MAIVDDCYGHVATATAMAMATLLWPLSMTAMAMLLRLRLWLWLRCYGHVSLSDSSSHGMLVLCQNATKSSQMN